MRLADHEKSPTHMHMQMPPCGGCRRAAATAWHSLSASAVPRKVPPPTDASQQKENETAVKERLLR